MQYIFTCILPAGSRILSVRMHMMQVSLGLCWHQTRCWLYGHPRPGRDGTSACWQRHGREPGTTGDGKPGIRDGKPGTHDGASGTTGYGKHGTGNGKPGTRDGEPEPGTRDQGVPGTADGMARDGTSAGNDMDHA